MSTGSDQNKQNTHVSDKEYSLQEVVKVVEDLKKENDQYLSEIGKRLSNIEERISPEKSRTHGLQRGRRSELLSNSGFDYEEQSLDCSSTEAYSHSPHFRLRKKKTGCIRTPGSVAASLGRRVRHDNSSGFAAIQSEDLQAEYGAIRDTVAHHKLPRDLKFSSSSRGIKAQSRDSARISSASARYVETCIKIASSVQAATEVSDEIDDLLICLIAHMWYVQEEHCLLTVGSNYGPRTQQIFRMIHNNPGQYTPAVIEELKTSATLAALPAESSGPPPT